MSQPLARALVFFTSASVLVIEILAARILAPYLGVSLEVFTGVIGTVLAGISVGAWLGGRAADRGEPRGLLGPLLVAGGLTGLASPLIIDGIGPSLSTGPVSIVVAASLGFFIPAALLSALPPVVVKIRLSTLAETGSVVGSYSAIGTAGAIFGTFVTGFVLIAAFATRPIVIALGAALTLTGLVIWSSRNRWAVMVTLAATLGLGALLLIDEGPCQYETTYHCAIVEADPARPTGRTLILDRYANSYVDVEDPTHLEFRYIRLMSDIIETELSDGPLDAVSIGGGGFTLPGYIEATRPGSDNMVLEIDHSLVDIGIDHLALHDEVDVIIDDARISLRNVADGSADVVIGDAFSGASVPWHLTTREFAQQIKRVLEADGVYVMNVIDYGSRLFARSAAATLATVFDEVAVFAPEPYLYGNQGGNYVLAATSESLAVDAIENVIASRGGSEIGIEGAELASWIGGALVLEDDYAPVDQLLGRR